MRKHSNLIVIISSLLIVMGVVLGSILTDYSSQISTVVTTVTAIIGAVALWIQFKKDREINQSSFIIEFYKSFYENESNIKVLNILDKKYSKLDHENLKNPALYADILNYASWIRTLCNLIDRGVVTFDTIDEIFSYKFFVFLNNKDIQELELIPCSELYKLIYRTHRKWSTWREKNGLKVLMADENLASAPNYNELSK